MPAPSPEVEIERKFLLSALPSIPSSAQCIEIEQGWLPGQRLQERLRRSSHDGKVSHWRTVKLGSGLERIEVEEEADAGLFDVMWPLTEGRRVRKRRYLVPAGERVWEIDEFVDRELFLAEIELQSREESVEIPSWLEPVLVRDVTDEGTYVNRNLAR